MEKDPRAQLVAQERSGGRIGPGVPPAPELRQALRQAAREYVARVRPAGPLSLEELTRHADQVVRELPPAGDFREFLAVLISNEVWREALAAVPYDQRLLLLPQCLRERAGCRAKIDPYGLLCRGCGRCVIDEVQSEAQRLGYVVLVAEGSPVVTSLIAGGGVQAVVGVSCLAMLQRVFPYMEQAGIPGMAIPLLSDGCESTSLETDWLWETLYLSGAQAGRLDLEALRREVESWFTETGLEAALGPCAGQTEQIARQWLSRSGKRWRPFLAVCACRALQRQGQAPAPEDLRRVALAVECFHKASLAHDDIEDGDGTRYGRPALHAEHGVPVALNVGDFLLGEGYGLLCRCALDDRRKAQMLAAAAGGHRELSLGQGAELCWRRDRRPMSPAEVIDIFRRKTAPAFAVALRLGALCAGAEEELAGTLDRFSEAMGVAYQIADDLSDFSAGACPDLRGDRPSFLLALAHERAGGEDRRLTEQEWRGDPSIDRRRVERVLAEMGIPAAAAAEMDRYRRQAVQALEALSNENLKMLLRRVLAKIFQKAMVLECCREFRGGDGPPA